MKVIFVQKRHTLAIEDSFRVNFVLRCASVKSNEVNMTNYYCDTLGNSFFRLSMEDLVDLERKRRLVASDGFQI